MFFNNLSGLPKSVECIRVNGASDEGPSHEEVQFYWAAHHLSKGKIATLVTSRSSGSSDLNHVELQNGCLSLGHANTFIPSTLKGSCVSVETGMLDDDKLKENLMLPLIHIFSELRDETETPKLWIACNALCEHLSVIPQDAYICCVVSKFYTHIILYCSLKNVWSTTFSFTMLDYTLNSHSVNVFSQWHLDPSEPFQPSIKFSVYSCNV